MDLATPTTSKATKPKRRRRPKPFTPNRSRKPKNVRVKLVVEPAHNFFEIEKILRKAEFVSSGGETKYLVSWPNTWEPEDNLDNCPELLEKFETGLPQSIDADDDNSQPFPSDWVVEQILERRYDENGIAQYLLKWQNSWVDVKNIRAELVQDYEDTLKLKRLMAMDVNNAINNNNNNDMDIDGVVKIKQEKPETMKRKRSTSTDDMDDLEPNSKKPDNILQKKLEEPNPNLPKVIEMELITLSDQRKIARIIDIGRSSDGSFSFMLKFETGEFGIIKRQLANIKYPQDVIAFYQRRIQFS